MVLQMFTLVCVMMTLQAIYYQLKIRLNLAMVNSIVEKLLSGFISGLMAVILTFYSIDFSFDISIGLAVTSLLIGLIYSGPLTFSIGYTIYGFWYFLNPFSTAALDFVNFTVIGLVLIAVNHFIRNQSVYLKAITAVVVYAFLSAFSIYLVSGDLSFTLLTMSLYLVLASISIYAGVLLITYMQTYRKMFSKMEFEATHDALTGLLNRRYFNQCISELASDSSASLLLIDIDKFKSINDTYGHAAGDAVLQQIADTAKSVITEKRSIARIGGEEFAVILRHSSLEEAKLTAEKLRAAVERQDIGIEDLNRTVNVTVSIGIASYPEETKSIRKLYDTADERLYFAKKLGRNQIHYNTPKEIINKLK